MQKRKTKNEFVFRFSYFTFENEKRKTNSFFVFLTSLLKTKNEKGIRFSFFVRKFENEKRKNGIYTDLYASQFFWTKKWGGQFLCCPPPWKSGGDASPRPPPIDARVCMHLTILRMLFWVATPMCTKMSMITLLLPSLYFGSLISRNFYCICDDR